MFHKYTQKEWFYWSI